MTCFYPLKRQTYNDNTITAACNTLIELLKNWEHESESALSWFKQNEIIVNADKFQAIISNKKESEAKYKLTINSKDIESTKSIKLLGNAIDGIKHAAIQLNALG